ncbi:hypothetical protein BDA99DRAFT_541858 [Phascolomyces articulosus]|uniref:Uncharacterized protein n=1 Tax=Phascolomyces articulosus TaxID=60185 RepID=A0AAD5PAZ1_9FUNG|nr:hypothetical protein BDA99DRAFT_541858 [Phascolomyces articulosus]
MVCALVFLMMTIVAILPHYVQAYCFYNHMNDITEVTIHQEAGQAYFATGDYRFEHKNMPPGSKECCPYTSRHCSETGEQDGKCSFYLAYRRGPNGEGGKSSYKTNAPCGGYITATGSFDSFSYQVYAANHTQVIEDIRLWEIQKVKEGPEDNIQIKNRGGLHAILTFFFTNSYTRNRERISFISDVSFFPKYQKEAILGLKPQISVSPM